MGSTTSVLDRRALKDPAIIWVTGFGSGFMKPAPGTWGSLAALAAWWLVLADLALIAQVAIVVAYTLISWGLCEYVCRKYTIDDAPQIVADEVAGMWLALVFLPDTWWIWLIAFALFRLLDITKPFAIGWLDRRVPGGAGVMVDDVVAGLIAGFVLQVSLLMSGAV